MTVQETAIPDVKRIVPRVFGDARGYFMESYRRDAFEAMGIPTTFCQDNESCSARGVLRGLHYQRPPFAQAKLIRVIRGAVWDVAVDLRPDSPTFGKHVAELLSADNHCQLFIPRGFAHGFLVLEADTVLNYKCDQYYAPQQETGIRWNDPRLAIPWPDCGSPCLLSEKDRQLPFLESLCISR